MTAPLQTLAEESYGQVTVEDRATP